MRQLAEGLEARVPCLHAAHAGHALVLREGVGGERGRERAARGAPAEPRGQVAQVEGVVAAALHAVVGRVGGGAEVVQEGEVALAPQVVREGEVVEVAGARAARQVHLARREGAVRDTRARDRRVAGPPRHDVHDAARAGLREGERRRPPVDLDVVDRVERQVGQVDGLVLGAAERHAVQVDLHLPRRGAADRDRAEVAEAAEAADLDADRVGERLGEGLHPGRRRGRVHDRGEGGRITRRRLLPRRRRRHHDLAERLLAPLLRSPRPGDGGRQRQDEERCGSVRRASLPARRGEEAERRAPAAEGRSPNPPSSFPAEGPSAGLSRAGFLARGSSSPGPFPPRRAVVATGFVPPHSCGAAGASHPLP